MIPLRMVAEAPSATGPFVVRLNRDFGLRRSSYDAYLSEREGDAAVFDGPYGPLRTTGISPEEMDGDVVLVLPEKRIGNRLIRAASAHNTLLVTERCDQLCVMCSQPPKRHHVDLFEHLETAALLAPEGSQIGLSGGEPTLFKDQLFEMISRVLKAREDLSFHVLTNGQHFDLSDLPVLRDLPESRITWGVPLYGADAVLHDAIVGKDGAFHRLTDGLALLCRAGAMIELRTVVVQPNVEQLPAVARFVTTHLPFVLRWAIMQLENIGFGRKNWGELFVDSSDGFGPIGTAIDIVRSRGIDAQLYNFPLCTVPPEYRPFAPSTISDWKRRYLDVCSGCSERLTCGGFFEWYPEADGFRAVRPI